MTEQGAARAPHQRSRIVDCHACLDACKFLDHKHQLNNYREQCRKYILHLDLEDEVCGKCIKACLRDGFYADQFKL